MQKLIIFAALVACGLAAPLENIKEAFQTADLSRPSPINPDIPSDPKPEEKVTLIAEPTDHQAKAIADPEKIPGPFVPSSESVARSKRDDKNSSESEEDSSEEKKKEAEQTPAPLVQSSEPLTRSKRADKNSSESEEDSSEEKKKEAQQTPGPLVPSSEPLTRSKRDDKSSSESEEDSSEENSSEEKKKRKHRPSTGPSASSTPSSIDTSSSAAEISATPETSTAPPTTPRIPYAPEIHQHNEHLFKPSTDAEPSESSALLTTAAPTAIAATEEHTNEKRDIPVPLTRKNQPADEQNDETKQKDEHDTPKVPAEEVKQEETKAEDHNAVPTPHPATVAHPIPVAELFGKKPSTE